MKKILLIGMFLVSSLFISAQVQDSWMIPHLDFIYAKLSNPCLVIDQSENIYTGVNTSDFPGDGTGLHPTFRILKFTKGGTQVLDILESVEVYDKNLVDMAVDNSGNIYCTVYESRLIDPVTPRIAGQFAVYKYNANGTTAWKRTYSDGEHSTPRAMALDASGNVYVTGGCKESGLVQNNPEADYLTVKWNSSGERQWERRYDGASPGEGLNHANDIVVDGAGNVYITGFSQRDGEIGYATIKYNTNGTELWVRRYTGLGSGDDRAEKIILDVSGFVYITGSSEGAIATIKYSNDGTQLWVQREGSGDGIGREIKVDASGNVYVAGNSSQTQMAVIKYRFDGVKLWTASRNNAAAYSLALDASGQVYMSGTSAGDGVVIKYNSSGAIQWEKSYDSPLQTGYNYPIKVTSDYNVYVISFISQYRDGNAHAYYDSRLFKYTQCTIICSPNLTINNEAGKCDALVLYNPAAHTGECGSHFTYSQGTGTRFPVGTTTVTVTSDATGATCSFTITVLDKEAPVAKAKNITVQLNAAGNVSVSPNDVDNGSSDVCGIQSMALSKTSFDCSNIGANTVVLTVTDASNNTATASATVTVEDKTAPVAKCKNITAELDASGNVSITASQVDDGSTDACGIKSLSLNKTTFNCSNKGNNTITLTAVDNNNNSATCTSTVTVVDKLPPIITSVVATPSYLWPPDGKMKNVTIATSFTDNCPGTTWKVTKIVVKQGNAPGDDADWKITGNNTVSLRAVPPKNNIDRIYTVTVTCTDASGNTSTSSIDIIVAQNGGNSVITQSNNTNKNTQMESAKIIAPSDLNILAYPNPSSDKFSIIVQGSSKEQIIMQVTDMYGRVIETRNINANSITQFGDRYMIGTYFVRIIQGKEHKEIKLVKIN